MKLIVCVENSGGISFNGRRVSRDRVVSSDILAMAGDSLWMFPSSQKLFGEAELDASKVTEDCLMQCGEEDYLFFEGHVTEKMLEACSELVLYQWNRDYPSDVKLDFEESLASFTLEEETEFPGYSHEKVTKSLYKKCNLTEKEPEESYDSTCIEDTSEID